LQELGVLNEKLVAPLGALLDLLTRFELTLERGERCREAASSFLGEP
jgi:hypothetical protein